MGRAQQLTPATTGTRSDLDRLLEAEREAATCIEAAEIEARRIVAEAEVDAARLDADPQETEKRRRALARDIEATTTEALIAEERLLAARIADLEAIDDERRAEVAEWLLERVLNCAESQGSSP